MVTRRIMDVYQIDKIKDDVKLIVIVKKFTI